MNILTQVYQYFLGPNIHNRHNEVYQHNLLESFGSTVVTFFQVTRTPIFVYLIATQYHRGDNFTLLSFFVYLMMGGYVLRAVGRIANPEYREMLQGLAEHYKHPNNTAILNKVLQFDLDISALHGFDPHPSTDVAFPVPRIKPDGFSLRSILAWGCVNTFGRYLVYPGTISLISYFMGLHHLRREMFSNQSYKIKRYPLLTKDKNIIDVVFIDKRQSGTRGGEVFIVCDGNAGFYEGNTSKPLVQAGYSVIIWNQPGFGQSTGAPWPSQVLNAANAIYALAKNVLEFDEVNIYAWSIGGFPGSWLAANYNIKKVIIDASFDDLTVLAKVFMPKSFESIVEYAVGRYFYMPIPKLLSQHSNDIVFFRRTLDEVITTDRSSEPNYQPNLIYNRGNYLLLDFLMNRYKFLKWTEADRVVVLDYLKNHQRNHHTSSDDIFPRTREALLGQSSTDRANMIRKLIGFHLRDFRLTHCATITIDQDSMPKSIRIPTDMLYPYDFDEEDITQDSSDEEKDKLTISH